MDEMLARCRSCGYEQTDEFAHCPVCMGLSSWWCNSCRIWCSSRRCPACRGAVVVPAEIVLGAFPVGSRVPVQFSVRNPSKKSIEFSVSTDDTSLSLLTRRLVIRPGEEAMVIGVVAVGMVAPGKRSYRIRFETAIVAETRLILEVIPAIVRLEFVPPELVFHHAAPGKTIRQPLTVNNTGNIAVAAPITTSEAWLGTIPAHLALAPGESSTITIIARLRKSDWGVLTGEVRIAPTASDSSVARIRVKLPEPCLEAAPVEFGRILPDRPTYETVLLRNMGKVRVNCSLACDQPWLAVSPTRVNIPVGGEKHVKLRATLPSDLAGPRQASLIASSGEKIVLSVPISLQCRVPRPILAPIRKQTLGAIANDVAVVRRFRVANTGDGPLRCSVSADQSWVEVFNPEFEVVAGKKRRIEYLVRTPMMQPGLNQATIQIRSNGGELDILVSVKIVLPKPELHLLGNLDLGTVAPDRTAEGQLFIRNRGVGMLVARAVADDDRLTLNPAELTIAPGPPIRIGVAVAVEGLEEGEHTFGLSLITNAGKGRAKVRLRLPVERIDAPATIDLGDRLAGCPDQYSLKVKNAGPDALSLAIRSTVDWLRPEVESVDIAAGASDFIPVSLLIQRGMQGLLNGAIVLEGRKIQHTVDIAVMTRRIEVVGLSRIVGLGTLRTGDEAEFEIRVTNLGDWQAEFADIHRKGELEVWIRRQAIRAGETKSIKGKARLNARRRGRRIETEVDLGHEVLLGLTCRVYSSRLKFARLAFSAVCTLGLLMTASLAFSGRWDLGGLVCSTTLLIVFAALFIYFRNVD